MSLGLPEFGSRRSHDPFDWFWRVVGLTGLATLLYVVVVGAIEWRSASSSDAALGRARADVAQAGRAAEGARRRFEKSPDTLIATASIESSPARVLKDLEQVLPPGVSIPVVRVEYLPEAATRLDITVVARTTEAYDRFLSALSKSPRFGEIKPGAEIRPGLVRATLTAVHRPEGASR
jgi:Tfp pilus assembly protein PilN